MNSSRMRSVVSAVIAPKSVRPSSIAHSRGNGMPENRTAPGTTVRITSPGEHGFAGGLGRGQVEAVLEPGRVVRLGGGRLRDQVVEPSDEPRDQRVELLLLVLGDHSGDAVPGVPAVLLGVRTMVSPSQVAMGRSPAAGRC